MVLALTLLFLAGALHLLISPLFYNIIIVKNNAFLAKERKFYQLLN
jgi:hypothetical protein